MAKGTSFLGVWRPGKGAQWWVTGLAFDDFKAKDKAHFDNGLRLVCLRVRDGIFSAVWQPGSGAQWWVSGKSFDEFKAKDKEHFDNGLRLVDIEIDNGKFTGVWRPGKGAQWWVTGLSFADFKAKDKEHFDNGLRLVCLRVVNGAFTGVWRPGSGAQWWITGKSYNAFKAKDKEHFDNGLRLQDIEIHNGEFTGVWRPGKGAQWWFFGNDFEMFKGRDKGYFDSGLRLLKIFPYLGGCDGGCLNQVVMPTGSYNYGITRTSQHCPGLPGTCGTPGPGSVVSYRWPNLDFDGTQRYVRLSALEGDDRIFTLPFSDSLVKRRGTWLYEPGSWHHAIDYSRDDRDTFKVLAAAAGRVIHIGWDWWSGNTIVVSHDAGGVQDAYRTIYMHLRNGPQNDCSVSWSETVPNLGEPRLTHFKKYLNDTGCPQTGKRDPQSKFWGTESDKIDMSLLGKKVKAGAFLAWAGDTGPGGCGCTGDKASFKWGGGGNTHLHIFFARRDPSNNEWYFIDPYGLYGPPSCYPASFSDPISTACARYPITWKGGKTQYP